MESIADDFELEIEEEQDEPEAAIIYDIASYPSDLTLSVIYEMWKNGDIEIPEYQRNYVWKIKQASLLIESFLLGLPIPQVFFYVDEKNNNLVIDGQQRILSVIYFMDGNFGEETVQGKRQVFRLHGLNEKSPFFNKRYIDLDEKWQKKLKGSILRAINIRQLNPKGESTSVYHIFERLNTGGTPLKPQEIRNCVYLGEFSKTLKTLNEDTNWRKIIGKKKYDKHQKDVELILRIFSLFENWDKYQKPMKDFLSREMKKEQLGKSNRVQNFVSGFKKISKVIVDTLGEKPFHIRGPLNASVLDSVFCILLENKGRLPDDLDLRFKKLIDRKDFLKTATSDTSDVVVLKKRFELAEELLIEK